MYKPLNNKENKNPWCLPRAYTYQQEYFPHDEGSSRKLLRRISWNETHNEKHPEHNANLKID